MSTQFQPLEIPPGVVTKPTKNMRSSNWAEVNCVRWIEGELQPIGGMTQYNYTFASPCRRIHVWYDLQQTVHTAYVCEQNIYVDTTGTLIEITPAAGWLAPPLPNQGGYGDLNFGEDLPLAAPTTGYGDPRLGSATPAYDQMPPVWSVDNFGSILLMMSSVDGFLYEWDPASAPGTLATKTTSPDTGTGFAPNGRCFVVTAERFVMLFGMHNDGVGVGGFRRFGWCDQENRNAWNFSNVVSQAGFLDIEPSSPIICADSGKFGVIFFTAKKAYLARYQGLPFIYGYSELADNCTPISPASITSTSAYLGWMSEQGMFMYDGSAITPVDCSVRGWIIADIDPVWARQVSCLVHFPRFNELWWFYPQNGQTKNTRAAIYNYRMGWWSQAQMPRTAGVTASYLSQPILADGVNAYQHEVPLSTTYINADPPWAETADLNLTSGARLATLKQVIPDVGGDANNVQFQFWASMSRSTQDNPPLAQWSNAAPITLRNDGYVDARVTGRDIRMKISLVGPQIKPFTLGQSLIDFAVRGDR